MLVELHLNHQSEIDTTQSGSFHDFDMTSTKHMPFVLHHILLCISEIVLLPYNIMGICRKPPHYHCNCKWQEPHAESTFFSCCFMFMREKWFYRTFINIIFNEFLIHVLLFNVKLLITNYNIYVLFTHYIYV